MVALYNKSVYGSLAVLMLCRGFSVDTEHPIIFRETAEGFGQSVVQFGSGANAG